MLKLGCIVWIGETLQPEFQRDAHWHCSATPKPLSVTQLELVGSNYLGR